MFQGPHFENYWANYLNHLSSRLFICKMAIMVIPTLTVLESLRSLKSCLQSIDMWYLMALDQWLFWGRIEVAWFNDCLSGNLSFDPTFAQY